MRVDKFLKVAHIIKRRTIANEACGAGRVSINGRVAKAGAEVKPGDEIGLQLGGRTTRYRVVEVREHVSKADAPSLYQVLE